jgi:hypothetical protein
MLAHDRTRSSLVIAAVLVLALTACSGQETTTDNGGSGRSTAANAPSTHEPSAGPMTGVELVWLEGVGALHKTMDNILQDAPSALTTAAMSSLANQLAGCTPALDKLGPPTDRLRPVHDLARKGCARYEEGGKCFATAAGLGIVVKGSDKDRQQTDAISCGFSTPGDGSRLLAEAEGRGFEIKKDAQ